MHRDKNHPATGRHSSGPVLPAFLSARHSVPVSARAPSFGRPRPAGKVSHRVAGLLLSSMTLCSCTAPDAMSGKEVRITYGEVTAGIRFPSAK